MLCEINEIIRPNDQHPLALDTEESQYPLTLEHAIRLRTQLDSAIRMLLLTKLDKERPTK